MRNEPLTGRRVELGADDGPRVRRASLVVGLSGQERDADALVLARTLQSLFGGEIVLAHVATAAPLGHGMVDYEAGERFEGRELLARAAATMPGHCDTELIGPWPPGLALARVAAKRQAEWIVLGTGGRIAGGRIVPGGVTRQLLKNGQCGIAVAPREYSHEPGAPLARVGIAFDATRSSTRALFDASAAAALAGASLYVYHVAHRGEAHESSSRRDNGPATLERALEQMPSGIEVTTRLLEGDAGRAIAQAAREDAVDLLFAGSRGYGPWREALLGGVTAELLAHPPCPLMLIPHAVLPGAASELPI